MRPLVLNTRSKNQAGEFTSMLEEAGFHSVEIPALEISNLDCVTRIVSELQRLKADDVVAFTSANAAVVVEQSTKIKELLSQFKIGVIGTKTAAILQRNGLTVRFQAAQASSADLAELIASKQPRKVLYLSGVPNTGTLKEILSSVTDFVEIPVYSSAPSKTLKGEITKHKIEVETADYITFLSKESLVAFHYATESMRLDLREKKCVVISKGVANAAKDLGYEKVIVSQARSVEAIVSELELLSSGVG